MTELLIARTDRVVTLTINRPEAHNALNSVLLTALERAIDEAVADPAVRAIVVTGSGDKAFSAGADLQEIAGMNADQAREAIGRGQRVFRRIERSPVPVIAAVNGLALGGGFELVLAATFAIVSSRAELGLPESRLGLIPGYGGTQRLARLVGSAVAAHVMLTGARINADRAYQLGLTPLPVVTAEALMPTALSVADNIAAQGPLAVRSVLQALEAGRDAPIEAGLGVEAGLAALAIAGAESTEGINAFLQRRPANFPDPVGPR